MEAGEVAPWVKRLSQELESHPWRPEPAIPVRGVGLETGVSWDSLTAGL